MIKQAVILAAGRSSRFWPLNQRHKSLIKVMGKPLIFYTLKGLEKAGVLELIVVQSPQKDVEKQLQGYNFKPKIVYVSQEEPRGMGNALWQARDLLKERFLVLNAERIDGGEIVKEAKSRIQSAEFKGFFFGTKTKNPHLFGIMRMEKERVVEVIEKPKQGKEPSDIKVVGIYILEPDFFQTYQKVEKHTYDFETALSKYGQENKVGVVLLDKKENRKETPSLKYPWHLFNVQGYLLKKYLRRKTEGSAKVIKGVSIQGRVYIGQNTKIYKYAVIKGPCYIGNNCVIGNHALIRANTNIEDNGIVGAYSEITRSNFQEGVHTHSNFIGDSILGRECRMGAGTVTANLRIDREEIKTEVKGKRIGTYQKRLGCIMGQATRVGVNCSFMPGIMVGSDCVIGPGSLIEKNIPDQTVFYNQFQRTQKKNRETKNET